MSIDYPLERYLILIITDDRSLRQGFLPESSSAEPADPSGDSYNAESKNCSCSSTDGYDISRRFASRPFSLLSANGADVLE